MSGIWAFLPTSTTITITQTDILALLENSKSCVFSNRPQMPAFLLSLFSQSCQNGLLQKVARPHVILPSKPSNGFSVYKKKKKNPKFLACPRRRLWPVTTSQQLLAASRLYHTRSLFKASIPMCDLFPYVFQVFAQTAPPQRGLPEVSVPALLPPPLSLPTPLFWSISCLLSIPPLPWLLPSQLQVLLGQGLFFILSSAPKRYRPSLHKFLLNKRMNK